MVTVQHPAVAAAFWQSSSHHHPHHLFAFPATACAPLVPHWHPSCVSMSGRGLPEPTPCSRGNLGQALASSVAASAAFLPLAPQPPPQPPPGPPCSHVLLRAQSLAPQPQAIATVDPEQPIGYGSFGVVWYVCTHKPCTTQPDGIHWLERDPDPSALSSLGSEPGRPLALRAVSAHTISSVIARRVVRRRSVLSQYHSSQSFGYRTRQDWPFFLP